jgi:peptide/nickel transport system ATP-binding protein
LNVPTGDTVLRMEGLRVEAAAGTVLVDDIDLYLVRGEVLGLIGESGAGKSTIGLAALAFARAGCRITAGRILLSGMELRDLDAAGRRAIRGTRVAYVAQSAAAAFNPAMTIGDQVCEAPVRHALMTRRQARARSVELFQAFDLPEPEKFGGRYPHQVSGGQLQRAMTAMAIACRPDVLVLDEPTTALDVTTQIEVLSQLKQVIARFGTAALYVSHDIAVVAQIADRIMVLRHGRMVETGATAQILNQPRADYTRALIAERKPAATGAAGVQAGISGAGAEAAAVLDVRDLCAGYGRRDVVKSARFTVARGETVAIVGASGSGKTTLANAVSGQVAARSGEISFLGAPLATHYSRRNRDALRRIQLVLQSPDIALNPHHSIELIVGRPLAFYFGTRAQARRARVAELLTLVGLDPSIAIRKPGQLSGGQKQRVCIARALAAQPDLIVCDEITSALDPLVAEEILALLRRLQAELGTAYLFITHDLANVRRIADRMIVMLEGRIVVEGATTDVLTNPTHPYLITLMASVPEMRAGWLEDVLKARVAPQSRPTSI